MSEQTAAPMAEPAPLTATPAPAAVPPMPSVPPAAPSPRPPRRVLRAVARWTAAVLVCGVVGAGTAYGITSMERTDVPGLATESDGRWDYPALSLPALPAGSPRPFSEGNTAEVHYADLRDLLLPAPAGATEDKKLKGGWVSTAQFVSEYQEHERAELTQLLADSAPRHVAARGWTVADGTESRIYLLQFNSAAYAQAFFDDTYISSSPGPGIRWPDDLQLDQSWEDGGWVPETRTYAYGESRSGRGRVHQAYIRAGDTVALLVQKQPGKKDAPLIPFRQTLVLQNQLLG